MTIRHSYRYGGLCALLLSVLTACGPVEQEAAAPPAARVSVVTLAPITLELTEDLPARVLPFQVAEIRPQVSGIVQRRLFEQGTDVSAGQPLFDINPAPFRAEVERQKPLCRRLKPSLRMHLRSRLGWSR
ncbi:hypothetical protein [Vreelandella lionensis]|uniref:hypothetical protein n=1 Tax=Vreelandella lionensis TaxID=1144478 RepID=UPI001FB287F3|nr:hypothetical protein [Halomonas lionensis]